MFLFSKKKKLKMPQKTKFVGKTDIKIVQVIEKSTLLDKNQQKLIKKGKAILGDGNYYVLRLPNGDFVKDQVEKVVKFKNPIMFVKDDIFCNTDKVASVKKDGTAYVDYFPATAQSFGVRENELYFKKRGLNAEFPIRKTPSILRFYKEVEDKDAKHFGLTKFVDKNGEEKYVCYHNDKGMLIYDNIYYCCEFDKMAVDNLKELEKNPKLFLKYSKNILRVVPNFAFYREEYVKRCVNILFDFIQSQKDYETKSKLILQYATQMKGDLKDKFIDKYQKDLPKDFLESYIEERSKARKGKEDDEPDVFYELFDERATWVNPYSDEDIY